MIVALAITVVLLAAGIVYLLASRRDGLLIATSRRDQGLRGGNAHLARGPKVVQLHLFKPSA